MRRYFYFPSVEENAAKWREIAKRADVRVVDVIAVFAHMCAAAGRQRDQGRFTGWSDEVYAATLEMPPEQVRDIRSAMDGDLICGLKIVGWPGR